ncbi:MAG TPA: sigma 54-interacting transcriptional regulator [Acidobacteriota bacterium]
MDAFSPLSLPAEDDQTLSVSIIDLSVWIGRRYRTGLFETARWNCYNLQIHNPVTAIRNQMNPRLVASSGPLKGEIIALADEEISIGRESSNQLCIANSSVSRRHCIISKEKGQYKISDLQSLNGTFVNGAQINQRLLDHGDQIKVGDSVFLFLLDESDVPPAGQAVQLEDAAWVTQSTIRLPNDEALYLQPDKVLATLPPTARIARNLNALLKISTAISSIRGLEALERKLLELIFEVVPAERGAILLIGERPDEFVSVFGWDKLSGSARPVRASRTVINRVLRENVAVLNNEVQDSAAFNASESLVASQVRSLLCVPLVAFGRVRGVIYLDTSDPMVRLDEEDLQLFTAIGGIAAVALDNARHLEWLESENLRLQAEINIEHNMVGESARMREVFQFIDKVAPTDATVLLCGESGTGKELVARAVHVNSPRAGKPFVAINCAALTETLLESELLGHERGAFTGAVAQKRGKFEAADGGTVFLDEIAELAPSLQAKLLRVLQEREFDRVGGTRPVKVDIRVIAATNKNLQEAIRNGTFRQDLYYRLNVVSLTMPPLRDRREDIPLLASHFVDKFSNKSKKQVLGISAQASASLMNYDWPGNVRELENAIERAVVLGSDELIRPEDLPETVLEIEPSAGASITKYHEAILEAKKQLIIRAVEQAGGNYTEAAKLLGVHPNYLHRLIRNMNLKSTLKSSR